ncbi:hypothetical protein IAR55_000728 [Kwoniella newhampshirensis]|uniref:Post-GPI attachment to proteins factor 3 n=1 Tax=Kwoniella newhampshirensis TaxID=1651941 RepID=A0AAW0Z3P6_9TREE
MFRPSLPILLTLTILLFLPLILASSGDRNPTFQHCLKGCQLTYCDPSQPPIPAYLRAFGWTCAENCAYECTHSFTDNIRPGSRFHQFYGKWAFYRFGPFQEPFSILMSLGNLWVNLKGLQDLKRRVRDENRMKPWLVALGWVQVNTWVWSSVFHGREAFTPLSLVFLTSLAMSLELFDFSPLFRLVDAHSLWHAATIPITIAWWQFMINDAIELEGSMLGGSSGGGGGSRSEKFPLSGGNGNSNGSGGGLEASEPPRTPNFAQLAAGTAGALRRSPSPSPKITKPE